MNRLPILFAAGIAIAATALQGCADSRATASGPVPNAPGPAARHAAPAPQAQIGASFAAVALDDRSLGAIRGGLSTGSGLTVNFSFQEATYVNNNLTQNIVVPTVTVSPGSGTAVVGSTFTGVAPSSIAGSGTTQVQVGSPALAVQSLLNHGMTSVVSSLGGGGLTNTISNAANNQLVQQVITANIDVTGLSHTIQQSVASTVLSRLASANAQFR